MHAVLSAAFINDRDQEEYFARPVLRAMIVQPPIIADRQSQFDLVANAS